MLFLASASPRRRELLERLGVEFCVVAADVDETIKGDAPPERIVTDLARRKARVVAERRLGPDSPTGPTGAAPRVIVLGADTVVVSAAGEILGKPRDAEDARRMLSTLAGTTHRVLTGVCVIADDHDEVGSTTTHITMRKVTDAEIDEYVASGEPFDKAGAYAIQETGDRFVTHVEGSWTNVVGLPLELVASMLARVGLRVTSEPRDRGGES